MSIKSPIPNRLIFSPDSPKKRKRSFFLITALVVIQLCLIWPVYPIIAEIDSLILGIPASFFWVILMVCFSFLALLLFYLKDEEAEPES